MVIIKDKDAIKLKIISLTIKINMDNINNIDYICSSKISETCLTVQYDVFTILIIRLFRVPSQPIKRAFGSKSFSPRLKAFGCSSETSFPWKEKVAKGQFAEVIRASFSEQLLAKERATVTIWNFIANLSIFRLINFQKYP